MSCAVTSAEDAFDTLKVAGLNFNEHSCPQVAGIEI